MTKAFYQEEGINWWQTPPKSPPKSSDLNPINNLWREVKEFIERVAKLKTKQKLIPGINNFWKTVRVEKCSHLKKVVPAGIMVQQATKNI